MCLHRGQCNFNGQIEHWATLDHSTHFFLGVSATIWYNFCWQTLNVYMYQNTFFVIYQCVEMLTCHLSPICELERRLQGVLALHYRIQESHHHLEEASRSACVTYYRIQESHHHFIIQHVRNQQTNGRKF